MTDAKDNRARQLAEAALQEVVAQVNRLEHAVICVGDDSCEATDAEVFAGVNLHYDGKNKPTDEEWQEYHDEEKAREAISEGAYGVEVRSDWTTPGHELKASEYTVLLAGGGPAVRIIGELEEFNQPYTARLEYQDWFTPWEEFIVVEDEGRNALLKYASESYCG